MIACLKNEDALSQILRRKVSNPARACLNNCDILVSHGVVVGGEADASHRTPIHSRAEQAGRPVDLKHRTDGQPACLSMVPMPQKKRWGGLAVRALPSTHTGGLAHG